MKLGARVILVFLLAACDHTPPFTSTPDQSHGPLAPGFATQLTYNPGTDLRPRWLPDGSGFFYTVERTDREDGDQCLARMASSGGTILETICDRSPTTDDSLATFEWAAVDADDQMAYVRTSTQLVPPSLAPRMVEIRLGNATDQDDRLVRAFPYTAPSGRVHQGLAWLQWLGATELLYLAEAVTYPRACSSCAPDTVRTGLEVVTLDPSLGVPTIVPGTDSATSVAVAGTDTIYYTRPSSNLVERRALSTGVVTTVATFSEPVRDVAAGGNGRLAAVTGVGLLWWFESSVNPQLLGAPGPRVYKRPAVSPDGRRIVVEGYDVIFPNPLTVSRSANIWLFELP